MVIPIAFTEYIASDIAILGRQGFFEAFEITFREWEKKLIIRSRKARCASHPWTEDTSIRQ